MRVKATVEFGSIGEAARWLAAYCSPPSEAQWKALAPEFKDGPGEHLTAHHHGVETQFIAREAVLFLYERFCRGKE